MVMEAEEIMNLFDSFWFSHEIFRHQSYTSNSPLSHDKKNQENPSSTPKIYECESLSYQASFHSDSFSPNSVLCTIPHLKTTLSGKLAAEEESSRKQRIEQLQQKQRKLREMRRSMKKKSNKSLSDLEFEELKGFMDLGFVFSNQDKNSKLVEIIPGLQRLGKMHPGHGEEKQDETENSVVDESLIQRPYLSEAWEVLERRNRENPLNDWRVPIRSNEIDIKDSLKKWAHTVASTVR